ncbi:MAG: chromosomal replication initiator protein DnaA [Xanthomonadales bacterium]|nr:chromosomal replication initiator protein DnaA [Xanthomonadales bacterium]
MSELLKRALDRLGSRLGVEEVQTWLAPLKADRDGERLRLLAPNSIIHDTVRDRFLAELRGVLCGLDDGLANVELSMAPDEAPPVASTPVRVESARSPIESAESKLEARYTFDNFVEGRSNTLAKATAQQVALKPGQAYNPLLLYGGTGLGKTHLLHATGNLIRKRKPETRVLYMRSEGFVSSMVKALRSGRMDEFKRTFRSADALLIDDIQFFANKEGTQEEFFHTFNALYDGQQQIVLTCDRYPKEVEGIEPRLRSRFGWGVSVAVEPPDFETRVAILLRKSRDAGIPMGEDVAQFVAQRMHSNVRELEGALNKLKAHANLVNGKIDLPMAQTALRDLFRSHEQVTSLSNIQKTVADYFRVPLGELLGKKRQRSLVRPRQMAMALAKELTRHSLPEIGLAFGGRDHTTVLHAQRVVKEWIEVDARAREDWENLLRLLSG